MTEIYRKWIELAIDLIMLGVEIKCEQTSLFDQSIYKISVPEKHELIEDYKPEEFMKDIKEKIRKLVYESCEVETDEDNEQINELFKVLGKVRDETWTQEKYKEKEEDK